MFSQQKSAQSKVKRIAISRDTPVTILTSGCHFQGKLFCRGSTRIGGKVEGEIVSEGLLILEEEAQIRAKVNADEVVIQGHMEGQLEARGRVELCSNGTFEGDVVTPVLVISEGAVFNGRSRMNNARKNQAQNEETDPAFQAEEATVHSIDSARELEIIKMPEVN